MIWRGMASERLWKVGELARAAGVTVRALHHYDRLDAELMVYLGRARAAR